MPLYERTLADRSKVLGVTHPDTMAGRNNLALAYRDAGRLDEAIPLLERTVADCECVLGVSHPQTLISRKSLAGAHQDAARLKGQRIGNYAFGRSFIWQTLLRAYRATCARPESRRGHREPPR